MVCRAPNRATTRLANSFKDNISSTVSARDYHIILMRAKLSSRHDMIPFMRRAQRVLPIALPERNWREGGKS